MNFRYSLTLIFILLAPRLATGQSYSEKRTFQKNFRVNGEMSLEISNKYGTIHLTTWNKDSVAIRAEIEASASSQSKLGKMFEGINVSFSESNYQIIAQTDFTQSIGMLFESFKGMTSKIIPYETRVQINYFVSLPENLNLKIVNKYGDIYMENNSADIKISLSNGSLKANMLNNASSLTLSFCDATINKINKAKIDASFSEVVIGESDNLSISSVSGRFELKQAGKIHADSRRDKFFFGILLSLDGDSYFTDFRIEELKNELNMITKYGSLNADLIDKGIQAISLNTSYTDINLSFDPAASYNLDIRHINSSLTTPEKNASLEKKVINEEKKENMTFGTVGKNPANVKVKIDANRGNIYIK